MALCEGEWRWQYTPGNQSARHPPLCAIWDVESRVCAGYSLNPAAAAGLAAFDLFSFKGLKCSRYCTLERHVSLHYPGRKKYIKVPSACYRYRIIQIQIKRLSGILKNHSIVDFINKNHLLNTLSRVGWRKLEYKMWGGDLYQDLLLTEACSWWDVKKSPGFIWLSGERVKPCKLSLHMKGLMSSYKKGGKAVL